MLRDRSLREVQAAPYGADTFVVVGSGGTILQSGPFPRFGSLTISSLGSVEGNITGLAGLSLQIQVSTNLTDWTPLTNVTIETSPARFIDSNASDPGGHFYRAVDPIH